MFALMFYDDDDKPVYVVRNHARSFSDKIDLDNLCLFDNKCIDDDDYVDLNGLELDIDKFDNNIYQIIDLNELMGTVNASSVKAMLRRHVVLSRGPIVDISFIDQDEFNTLVKMIF